ncbi:multicopper oxidase family protein [Microvirga pudoricolor]|uniref:multicopper oxidase family protein n=1 Tax=Microvirga pudoricolor TaxID=2778729 RepID=UPI00194E999E|nr:multicopper oxidase family protein [Microvirga pudoricolor]MBM6595805.1 multicopper oxidase family protein [Microvirga pudoricolor]
MHTPYRPSRRTALGLGLGWFCWTLNPLGAQAQTPPQSKEAPEWKAGPVKVHLRPDAADEAELWRFDGGPAPVLRVRQGEEVRLRVSNGTPAPLSLHFHGVRGPNAMDGVAGLTQAAVGPGEDFEYRFTPPDAGTFLIRPCIPGGSAEATERGLTGLLIVEEITPPPVDSDIALVLDDWKLSETGALAPFGVDQGPSGRLGNWLTVNGGPVPERVEVRPGSRVRLRLANASNARILRLQFDGMKPFVIAVDGQPTDTFEPLRASLPFPPGTRYDLLVDMPRQQDATGTVKALLGNGIPLLQLIAAGEVAAPKPAMAPIPENRKLPEAIRLQSATRADLAITYDEGARAWRINGKLGSVETPALRVKRGAPVVLALDNRTPYPQPFHLHGHSFRLLHAMDDGWEPYWLDTLQVPEKRTIRIAFVADNPGRWLLASTVLERFDAGLWCWIEVT